MRDARSPEPETYSRKCTQLGRQESPERQGEPSGACLLSPGALVLSPVDPPEPRICKYQSPTVYNAYRTKLQSVCAYEETRRETPGAQIRKGTQLGCQESPERQVEPSGVWRVAPFRWSPCALPRRPAGASEFVPVSGEPDCGHNGQRTPSAGGPPGERLILRLPSRTPAEAAHPGAGSGVHPSPPPLIVALKAIFSWI
ncbi:hypothetical protein NDU88_007566 [Pleurodeles waltl]|uniref:Uncharacterized protein n=1 Tax=Pleurodeles waltl TaxID=8319 RepID=A0AAV7SSR3_PLEWA|nr:hypothetical protein NDU88_007566 [Pleurodeles waltl]